MESINSPGTAASTENSTRAHPLIELVGLGKSFGAVDALKPLDLSISQGEILGLIGENGAGKSTLIKLLSGIHRPSAGSIIWNGSPAEWSSPRDSLAAGITTLHQELEFAAHLSVAENMFLGDDWPRARFGRIDWRRLYDRAATVLRDFQLDIDPRRRFVELTTSEKQETHLAVALSRRTKLLILDEPTASLSEPEVERLLTRLKTLRGQGVAMIYVTHRLDEILSLTDRVAVLRDGGLVAIHPTSNMTAPRLVEEMLGESPRVFSKKSSDERIDAAKVPATVSAKQSKQPDCPPLLELRNLSRRDMFANVSFRLRAGEIVGLTGLVGAGRSELARCIYGLYPSDSGEMFLEGKPWQPTHPRQSLARGLVYLPEERKRQGLVLDHSVANNISLASLNRLALRGLIHPRRERQLVSEAMLKYDVRAKTASQNIGTLSGGNQQKALLARWLETDPHVLIVDEPTRGVDVGAKQEIYQFLRRHADRGRSVLLISSDWPEVLLLADRVLVMNRGRIDVELSGSERTEHNVILAASGMYRAGTKG